MGEETAAAAIQILPINIIHPHARPTQPPVPIMALEMGVASAGGACTGSNSIVEFTKGTKIKSDTVAIKTSLDKGSVKFCCSKSVGKHCKGHVFPEKSFDCEEDKLEIKQDVRGKTRTCPATQDEPSTIGFKPLN